MLLTRTKGGTESRRRGTEEHPSGDLKSAHAAVMLLGGYFHVLGEHLERAARVQQCPQDLRRRTGGLHTLVSHFTWLLCFCGVSLK